MEKVVKLSKHWASLLASKVVIPTVHQYKEHMLTSSDRDIAEHNARVEAEKKAKKAMKGKL